MAENTELTTEDRQLEDELVFNERVIEHPQLGKVKLSRPTPRQTRLIAEEKRKQQHRDYQDDSILSRSQMEKLAMKRGDWSEEQSERMNFLYGRVAEIMSVLHFAEFENFEDIINEYEDIQAKLEDMFSDNEEVLASVERYFDLDSERDNADLILIRKSASSSDVEDLLKDADFIRTQLTLLEELGDSRQELNGLIQKSVFLFGDTIEARAENVQKMAELFYCVRDAETGDKLWDSVDAVWDEDAETIRSLRQEMFYFINGITDQLREMLGDTGFTARVIDTSDSSDDSPDHPKSSSDGESQESEQTSSSEATE